MRVSRFSLLLPAKPRLLAICILLLSWAITACAENSNDCPREFVRTNPAGCSVAWSCGNGPDPDYTVNCSLSGGDIRCDCNLGLGPIISGHTVTCTEQSAEALEAMSEQLSELANQQCNYDRTVSVYP